MPSTPVVFVSYSHDSTEHVEWVEKLARALRSNGVAAVLDVWDLRPGADLAEFMHKGITDADRVLMVCTPEYVEKAEAGSGGVGYERLIVTGELINNIASTKFIPIVRASSTAAKTPSFLGARKHVDFSNDGDYDAKLLELLLELHGQPPSGQPPVGSSPFSGTVPASISVPRTRSSGLTPSGERVLSGEWFVDQVARAGTGIAKLKLPGAMELRFGLHDPIGKSQVELLNAAKQAEIRTFGWPIGLVLEKEPHRPKPFADGIRTEVSMEERSFSGVPSYDYWAARTNGDYYLLQGLFEDGRSQPTKLFFNTRIVRVAEALMFCIRYYTSLGVPEDAQLSIRVTHSGLAGRTLASSSPNRYISSRSAAAADVSETEFVVSLAKLDMDEDLIGYVRRITAPMFLLFDFAEFADSIYEDIVTRFTLGEVT